jgi:hypothetical protein
LPAGFLAGLGIQGTLGALGSNPGGGVAPLVMMEKDCRGSKFRRCSAAGGSAVECDYSEISRLQMQFM